MVDFPKAFVCGHPIKHSRSPIIHTHWLAKYGLEGSYEKIDVEPGQLAGLFDQVRQGIYSGGNITLPHKEAALSLVDHTDDAAVKIGAVNTLYQDGKYLVGNNTDSFGFAANLDNQIPSWRDGQQALILGAGGASRAVLFALISAGYKKIYLANRTLSRAENLASIFGPKIHPIALDQSQMHVSSSDLIINTTSLGMNDNSPMPISLGAAKSDCLAADIVYIPIKTAFLTDAENHGLMTSDGLGMLLHQATPGFEKWFGQAPIVDDTLRQIVLDDINKEDA